MTLREDQGRRTTRGWNKYGPGDYRAFKYLTPKKRLEVNDLVEEGLFTAKTIHLICTPVRADNICSGLYKALQDRPLHPIPLVVWEPVPDSCNPANRMEMYIIFLRRPQLANSSKEDFTDDSDVRLGTKF